MHAVLSAVMQNQFREANPKFIGGNTLLQYFGVDNQDIWCVIRGRHEQVAAGAPVLGGVQRPELQI